MTSPHSLYEGKTKARFVSPRNGPRHEARKSNHRARSENSSIPPVPELCSRGSTPSSEESKTPASVPDEFRPALSREPINIEPERLTIVRFPTPVDKFNDHSPIGRQVPEASSAVGPSHTALPPPEPRVGFAGLDPLPESPFVPENLEYRKICADLLCGSVDLRSSLEEAKRDVREALEEATKAKLELTAEKEAMKSLVDRLTDIAGRDVVNDIVKKAAIVAEEGSDGGWDFEDDRNQGQAGVRSDDDESGGDCEDLDNDADFYGGDGNRPSESETAGKGGRQDDTAPKSPLFSLLGSYESSVSPVSPQLAPNVNPVDGGLSRKVPQYTPYNAEAGESSKAGSSRAVHNEEPHRPDDSISSPPSISTPRKRSRNSNDLEDELSGSESSHSRARSYKRRRASPETQFDDVHATPLLEQANIEQPLIEPPQPDANPVAQNTPQVGNPLRRNRERLRETSAGLPEVYIYEQDPDWLDRMNRHRVTMEKLSRQFR